MNPAPLDSAARPVSAAFPRVAAGLVFALSALVKLLFANQGHARFARLGLPSPALLAPALSTVELVAGTLLALGLYTRLAAAPLVLDMLVALAVSKAPLLWSLGPEPVAAAPREGLWAFAYQARLDLLLLLLCVAFVRNGGGAWSLDALWAARKRDPAAHGAPSVVTA